MSTTSLAQSVNRQHVGLALRQMRYDCQHNPRELTAINKASLNLEACTWYLQGERLVIESATHLHKRYHVDEAGCDCQAAACGRPCWHLAAWHLIQRASRIAAATQPREVQRRRCPAHPSRRQRRIIRIGKAVWAGAEPARGGTMLEHPRADDHYSLTELGELMLEIACTEGLDLDTALARAAAQLEELRTSYPFGWDCDAWNVGNWDVDARVIPF